MPLRAARVGRVGVIGHPVAKTAVVAKAVSPGPSPVAKTAVVAAAVTPGGSPPADLAWAGARPRTGYSRAIADVAQLVEHFTRNEGGPRFESAAASGQPGCFIQRKRLPSKLREVPRTVGETQSSTQLPRPDRLAEHWIHRASEPSYGGGCVAAVSSGRSLRPRACVPGPDRFGVVRHHLQACSKSKPARTELRSSRQKQVRRASSVIDQARGANRTCSLSGPRPSP